MKFPGRLLVVLSLAAAMFGAGGAVAWAEKVPRQSRKTDEVRVGERRSVIPGVVVLKLGMNTAVDEHLHGQLQAAVPGLGPLALRKVFPGAIRLRKQSMVASQHGIDRIYYVNLPSDLDPVESADRLSSVEGVEYAEPKFMRTIVDIPNDPAIASQNAAFARINLYEGWTLAKGRHNVVIAVVDGGTYWQHADIEANLWINSPEDLNGNGRYDPVAAPAGDIDGVDQDANGYIDDVIGWNFSNSSGNPNGFAATPMSYGHGTATASDFGAVTNNGAGMAGTSWNCAVMPICASSLTADRSIEFGTEGIWYAAANGASVVNCSFGGIGGYSKFEQDVITAATAAGTVVVCAAGNDGVSVDLTPFYPAMYRDVLSVGAINSTSDVKAAFSNYGLSVTTFAPGVDIYGATTAGGFSQANSGTSFSSPLVAGVVGLLRSSYPTWTPAEVAMQIRTTSDPVDQSNPSYAGRLGLGKVNVARALTESHPGLEVVSVDIRTTAGQTLFLVGDTLDMQVTVRNVLFAPASNISFTASSLDPAVTVLDGQANAPGPINHNDSVTFGPLKFRVGEFSASKDVVLELRWVSNGSERGGRGFRITVFPVVPNWKTQTSPTILELFSACAVDRSVAWASGGNGSASAPVVLRTTDGGENWSDVTGNLSGLDAYCISAANDQRSWIGTGDGRIFVTTDGGVRWQEQPYADPQSPFIDGVWFFDPYNGYALGDPPPGSSKYVVLQTSDGGFTWEHLTSEPVGASGEAGWNNSFWWADVSHGWFGTNKNRVWRTSDGGMTWSFASTGGTNSLGVSFRDSRTGVAVHDDGSVARTTDGGGTWSRTTIASGGPLWAVSYAPGSPSAWTISTSRPYRTRNDGATWTTEGLYPFAGSLRHITFADSGRGWLVTSAGEILCYSPDVVNDVPGGHDAGVPVSTALSQNFPNPFNPTTVIRFQISDFGWVRLGVYDVLGREVALLVNERKAPGRYDVQFDASRLSSGIYVYRLISGHYVESRRMVVVR